VGRMSIVGTGRVDMEDSVGDIHRCRCWDRTQDCGSNCYESPLNYH